MTYREYQHLQSERTTLQSLLDRIPETNMIGRASLERRIRDVERLLATQPEPTSEPTRALLTFAGKPIVGSYGVFAEFGASAIKTFADAIAAVGANETASLGTRGAIPNRNDYQLLLTGTALGSFGFELEEAPKDEGLFPLASLVEPAIEQTRKIMTASLGTDEELTEAIDGVAQRAIDALRLFLKTLADHEAICALEFKNEVFRFADVGQVRRSEARLSNDNIHEEDTTLNGKFLGVLPIHRTFEFRVSDKDKIIMGKVAINIENIENINLILLQPASIRVYSRQVGTSRPKYILLSYDTLGTQELDGLLTSNAHDA